MERDRMSVYVDKLTACLPTKNWKYDKYCHLIADTLEELHIFAQSIGLKREWFQEKSYPHYDITIGIRRKAIQNGAIEVCNKTFVRIMRKNNLEVKK
jgi:hypothetical protein